LRNTGLVQHVTKNAVELRLEAVAESAGYKTKGENKKDFQLPMQQMEIWKIR